jgi:hypothetical protein
MIASILIFFIIGSIKIHCFYNIHTSDCFDDIDLFREKNYEKILYNFKIKKKYQDLRHSAEENYYFHKFRYTYFFKKHPPPPLYINCKKPFKINLFSTHYKKYHNKFKKNEKIYNRYMVYIKENYLKKIPEYDFNISFINSLNDHKYYKDYTTYLHINEKIYELEAKTEALSQRYYQRFGKYYE